MPVFYVEESEAARLVAHIAGLHSAVATLLQMGVQPSGDGLAQVGAYAKQFIDLREKLRKADPERFGSLPTHIYSASIATRMTMLKSIAVDSRSVLVTAHALKLVPDVPPPLAPPENSPSAIVRFVSEHIRLIILGVAIVVIGAYFTNCFGLTHR